MDQNPPSNGATLSKFFRVAPFFLPFLFGLIPPLLVISPIPLFILTLRNAFRVSLLALLVNLLLLALLRDPFLLWLAALYWFSIGIFFPALIRKTGRVIRSATLSYLFQIGAILIGVAFLARHSGFGMVDYIRSEISIGMDLIAKEAQGPMKELLESEGREGLFKSLMSKLPAAVLIALMLSFWINLL
ncbi:MAG: DUF2232 domain-containing protein, partial [Proteobacteria bacterium]|nr:DUF2232 domain-containing protein [Pseudomonadota bacterium]